MFIWQNPPEPESESIQTRALEVANKLKERPNAWALIEEQPGLAILPWWGQLRAMSEIEVKIVSTRPDMPFTGPKQIYARYVGE